MLESDFTRRIDAINRLNEAAPFLLRALKELLEVSDPEQAGGYERQAQWEETLESAQRLARAAIAKAEGK